MNNIEIHVQRVGENYWATINRKVGSLCSDCFQAIKDVKEYFKDWAMGTDVPFVVIDLDPIRR